MARAAFPFQPRRGSLPVLAEPVAAGSAPPDKRSPMAYTNAGRSAAARKTRKIRSGWPAGTRDLDEAMERWEIALGTRRFDEPGMVVRYASDVPTNETFFWDVA